jgi:hypothetical protein
MESIATTAASISAVLAFFGVAARWVHRWFSRLEAAVATVERSTSTTAKQVTPNGGSSMRDDITAIRSTLDRHTADLATVQARVDELYSSSNKNTESGS